MLSFKRDLSSDPRSETLSSGKRCAEFDFDSKILFNCGVGYDRERCALVFPRFGWG
ncbi:hypothetical protein LEP1GSC170_2763 [Leptospira interrogans serovar Bataviae str. HAI135]|nr:hypothetical protein LEP1GSC170_2763 [Leptospira interrogans serovar Bataviae str. HAI135]